MAVGELIMNIRNVSSSLIVLIYDVKKCSCTYWSRLGSGSCTGREAMVLQIGSASRHQTTRA